MGIRILVVILSKKLSYLNINFLIILRKPELILKNTSLNKK